MTKTSVCTVLFATMCFSIVLLVPVLTPAQDTPPISVDALELPVGIRNLGMGATGVADITYSANGYYNPASIAWRDGAMLSYGHNDLGSAFADVDFSMTDWRATFGRQYRSDADSSLSVGVVFGYTDVILEGTLRTIFHPEGVYAKLRDYYWTAGLAFGWERGRTSFAGGATGKYMKLDLLSSAEDPDAWLFDFGLAAAMTFDIDQSFVRPRLGFSVTNLDNGLTIDGTQYDVAGHKQIGAGVDVGLQPTKFAGRSVAVVEASADIDYHDREAGDHFWALGWEISLLELVQARAGFQWYGDGYYEVQTLGAGIGWEFGRWMVRADYARVMPDVDTFDADFGRDCLGASVAADF